MRRRLHLVPFEVTISPEKRDPQLMSKLKSERDGILGWMVEGCAEWQRLERPLPGLPAPGAVLSPSHITLENNAKIGRIRIWRTLSRGQMADRKGALPSLPRREFFSILFIFISIEWIF